MSKISVTTLKNNVPYCNGMQHGKCSIQQEEVSFHTGLEFKEEISDMLLLNIDLYGVEIWTLRNYTSEIPRKF